MHQKLKSCGIIDSNISIMLFVMYFFDNSKKLICKFNGLNITHDHYLVYNKKLWSPQYVSEYLQVVRSFLLDRAPHTRKQLSIKQFYRTVLSFTMLKCSQLKILIKRAINWLFGVDYYNYTFTGTHTETVNLINNRSGILKL